MNNRIRCFLLVATVVCLGFIGCHKRFPPGSAAQKDAVIHSVSLSGENLSIISHWYTGKASNWKAILEANPQIKDSQKLRVGSQITIPGDLVTQRTPLTKKALTNYLSKGTLPSPTVTATATVEAKHTTTQAQASPTPNASPAPIKETPTQAPVNESQAKADEIATTTPVPTPAATDTPVNEATPLPELPTPSPSEIARDSLIDEILSDKPGQ